MIDIKRAILYGLLVLVVYTLWIDWQKEHVTSPQPAPAVVITPQSPAIPAATPTSLATPSTPSTADDTSSAEVSFVQTDVLKVGFDLKTGDLVDARFLHYKENLDDNEPFIMLNNEPEKQYIAPTRLFSAKENGLNNVSVTFSPAHFHVDENKETGEWIIRMEGSSSDDLQIKKEFVLHKGSYLIQVRYEVTNTGKHPWNGEWATQLSQTNPNEDKSSLFHLGSYSGAAISIPDDKLYKKISYSDMAEGNLDTSVKNGWIAMQQHYFLTAWIPSEGTTNKFYTQVFNNHYIIGALSEPVQLLPQQSHTFTSRLYVGPELMDTLKAIAPGLDLTIDYGWLSVISVFLFSILQHIYHFVGNWGWSIILVTLLIKLAFYRLSQKSYTSMANMRKLQPKLEELKQRFGDDKTKMSQATMELYRKEKVNPLGGCLPIIVQIPVFIALYWVLLESVQLRQAPFILWIKDLSVADPYYILPIIMGITMLIQQKLNPPPPDPMQAKVMMFLPVLFTGLFLNFPAGLVLYWVVNNTLSILQQWYITQKISNAIIKKRFKHKRLS